MFKIISFYEKVSLVPLSFCLWKLVTRLYLPLVGKGFCNCFANSKGKKKTFVRICFNLSNSFLKSSLSAYDFSRTFPKTAPVIQLYPFNSLSLSLSFNAFPIGKIWRVSCKLNSMFCLGHA